MRRTLKSLGSLLDRAEGAVALYFGGAIILLMMAITVVNVVSRRMFATPLPGFVELVTFLLVVAGMLAISHVQSVRGHVTIEALTQIAPPRLRAALDSFSLLASLVVSVLITWLAWDFAIETWSMFEPGVIRFPYGPFRMLVAIGFGLTSIHIARQIFKQGIDREISLNLITVFCLAGLTAFLIVGTPIGSGIDVHMSKGLLSNLGFVLLVVLLLLGTPIGFAMSIAGIMGCFLLLGQEITLKMVPQVAWSGIFKYTFTVVPLFVLLGNLAAEARYSEDLFIAARSWVGRIPGSLSIATVMTCAGFGTVSGSAIATSAMMAKAAVPEMEKAKYNEALALGTVASAGPIAGIIPPSVLVCLYGAIVEQPIGKLLIAGFLPGLLIAFLYSAMIYIRARIDPNLAPVATVMVSWREKFASLRNIWPVMVIAMVMLGGIYAGVFTPTEGASMGAFSVLILAIAMRRIGWKSIVKALEGTLRIVGILMLILSGAFIFNNLLVLGGVTQNLINFVDRLGLAPLSILICIMILFLFLGCFMDTAAMLFLALPVIFPFVEKSGFDPVWFGMLIIVNCETGMITPPFGLTLFATKGALPEKALGTIIRGSFPFVICLFVALILLIIFPQIILFLPNQMK